MPLTTEKILSWYSSDSNLTEIIESKMRKSKEICSVLNIPKQSMNNLTVDIIKYEIMSRLGKNKQSKWTLVVQVTTICHSKKLFKFYLEIQRKK